MSKNMKQHIVDAFTDKVFHGNQAAICIMGYWIPEDLMIKKNDISYGIERKIRWNL